MEGKYPLLIDGRESGELRVTRRGALTLFEAEAEDGGGILRLSVYGGGREGYLGVMSPSGEGRVALRRQLSRAALRDFPEHIEYAAPAGAAPAVTEPEPGPEPESAPEPEPGQDEGRRAASSGTARRTGRSRRTTGGACSWPCPRTTRAYQPGPGTSCAR